MIRSLILLPLEARRSGGLGRRLQSRPGAWRNCRLLPAFRDRDFSPELRLVPVSD